MHLPYIESFAKMYFWRWLTLLTLRLLIIINCYHQTDYKLRIERLVLDYYNKDYAKDVKVDFFHHTRYEKRINVSGYLLKDLPGYNIENVVQVFKFQSNEYRPFAVNITSNACLIAEYETYGVSTKNLMSNAKKCPLTKGFYYAYNLNLDESKFPPYAPRGRFMFKMSVIYNRTLLGYSSVYVEIVPTNPLEVVVM